MTTKQLEIYSCDQCGNLIEMLRGGGPVPVCCGEEMKLLDEHTADKTTEKHVPVIEKVDGGYEVTVGTTLHPMEDKHYIEWIELIADGKSYTQFLNPGDEPKAFFPFDENVKEVTAREHCNIHGLWKGNE